MTIEYNETLVVKDMLTGIPVTVLFECLDVPKTMFEDPFTGIYIHSVIGEHDIKNRKDLDKAIKDNPDLSILKNQTHMLNMNLDDANRFYAFLGRTLGYGQALKELEGHK